MLFQVEEITIPGAWEIQDKVLAAVIHTDTTTVAWAFGIRNLILPGQFIGLAGMPYDMARNEACKACLESGATWLFFLDSDVIPPSDAVVKLMSRGKPFISGLYCRRSPPHAVPVMIRNGTWVTDYPANSIIEVDVVGSGCMLIHRSVLEKCPPQAPGKRWFDWRVHMKGLLPPGECLSEDFTLCVHLKRTLGIPTLVDTSVQCRHIGFAQAGPGTFVPMDCVPIT